MCRGSTPLRLANFIRKDRKVKPIKNEEYSFNHVKTRLEKRFNIDIDRTFYDNMNKNIQPYLGKPDCGTDNNGEQEIHTMFVKNKIVKVVYSLSKNRITTVLPNKPL